MLCFKGTKVSIDLIKKAEKNGSNISLEEEMEAPKKLNDGKAKAKSYKKLRNSVFNGEDEPLDNKCNILDRDEHYYQISDSLNNYDKMSGSITSPIHCRNPCFGRGLEPSEKDLLIGAEPDYKTTKSKIDDHQRGSDDRSDQTPDTNDGLPSPRPKPRTKQKNDDTNDLNQSDGNDLDKETKPKMIDDGKTKPKTTEEDKLNKHGEREDRNKGKSKKKNDANYIKNSKNERPHGYGLKKENDIQTREDPLNNRKMNKEKKAILGYSNKLSGNPSMKDEESTAITAEKKKESRSKKYPGDKDIEMSHVGSLSESDPVKLDQEIGNQISRNQGSYKLDANIYSAKKNVAQGMLDIALLTVNATQLKYALSRGPPIASSAKSYPSAVESATIGNLLTTPSSASLVSGDKNPHTSWGYFFYLANIWAITISILLQILVGILLLLDSRASMTKNGEKKKAEYCNHLVVLGAFFITIINVFISIFQAGDDMYFDTSDATDIV